MFQDIIVCLSSCEMGVLLCAFLRLVFACCVFCCPPVRGRSELAWTRPARALAQAFSAVTRPPVGQSPPAHGDHGLVGSKPRLCGFLRAPSALCSSAAPEGQGGPT